MQDAVTFESYPTHPLGSRDSWPASGPIYGIGEPDRPAAPSRTFWQRLGGMAAERSEPAPVRSDSPIWY